MRHPYTRLRTRAQSQIVYRTPEAHRYRRNDRNCHASANIAVMVWNTFNLQNNSTATRLPNDANRRPTFIQALRSGMKLSFRIATSTPVPLADVLVSK